VCALTISFAIATAAAGLLNASFSNIFDSRFGDANAYGYAIAAIGAGYACGELMTGLMRRQTLARRSVSVAFLASAALVWTFSHSASLTTAYLLLFLLGAADGTTEVVRDTLIQLHSAASIRAAVFAVSGSIQMLGMIVGLVAAPVLLAHATTGTVLRVAAAALVASALVAAVGLVSRRRGDDLLVEPLTPDPEVEVVLRTLTPASAQEPAGTGPALPG
jgi:MFS family permease